MTRFLEVDPASVEFKILKRSRRDAVVAVALFKTFSGKLYPFKEPGLTLRLSKDSISDKWNCWSPRVNELSSCPGITRKIALYRWLTNFLRMFEEVRGKRSFERDEEEKVFNSKLRQFFDFRSYQELNPLLVVRYGVVAKSPSADCAAVDWENGDRETFELSSLPKEFKTVAPGDEIHALIEVDFKSGDAVGITKVFGIKRKENKNEKDLHS